MWVVQALLSRRRGRLPGGPAEPSPQQSRRFAKTAVVEGGCRWRHGLPASIHADRLAGDEGGFIGGEIGDHRGDLVGAAETADRDRLGALAEAGFEVVAIF